MLGYYNIDTCQGASILSSSPLPPSPRLVGAQTKILLLVPPNTNDTSINSSAASTNQDIAASTP